MPSIPRSIVSRIGGRPYYAFLYAKNILKARLPESLEDVLSTDPHSCYLYAKYVMKDRLPDPLHAAMILGSWDKEGKEYASRYFEEFGS